MRLGFAFLMVHYRKGGSKTQNPESKMRLQELDKAFHTAEELTAARNTMPYW